MAIHWGISNWPPPTSLKKVTFPPLSSPQLPVTSLMGLKSWMFLPHHWWNFDQLLFMQVIDKWPQVLWADVMSSPMTSSICQLLHSSHPFSGNCEVSRAWDDGGLMKGPPSQLNIPLFILSILNNSEPLHYYLQQKSVSLTKDKSSAKKSVVYRCNFWMHFGVMMSWMTQTFLRIPASWG